MDKNILKRRFKLVQMTVLWIFLVILFFAAWETIEYFFFPVIPKYIMKRIYLGRDIVSCFGFGFLAIWLFLKEDRRYRIEKIKRERLNVLSRFSSLMAHEIRNPLTSISLNAELLMQEMSTWEGAKADELKKLVSVIAHEKDQLHALTVRYLNLARSQSATVDFFSPTDALHHLIDTMKEELTTKGVRLKLVDSDGLLPKLKGDSHQFQEAFRNFIRNAQEAMPQGGDISLTLNRHRKLLIISLQDTGTGMTWDVKARLFEPFFTTKLKGTGLGLCLSYQYLQPFDATIKCQTAVGKGTTFNIEFPLVE